MNALSFLAALACALYIETGYRALALDHRGRKNRAVFAFCIILALWAIAQAFIYAEPPGSRGGTWLFLANLVWFLFVGAGTQFCLAAARPEGRRLPIPTVLIWAPGIVLAILYALRVARDSGAVSLLYGEGGLALWIACMIYFLAGLSFGLAVLLSARRRSRDRFDRKRLGLLALSIALPCALALLSDAIAPALGFRLPRLGILWCLFWALGVRIDMDRYGLMSPFHDMTDAGRLFSAFLDRSQDGIVVCTDSGRIVLWSKALENISGIPYAEAIDRDVTAISNELRNGDGLGPMDPSGVRTYIDASLASGGSAPSSKPLLNPIRNRRGEERWLQSLPFVIALSGGRSCLAAIVRDVTEERRAELAAREERKRLEQAEKIEAMGDLAAGLAHSFNNMIMGIKGTISVLRLGVGGQAPSTEAELVAALDRIDETTERGGALLKQLLELAHKAPVDRQPTSLAEAVERTLSSIEGLLDPSVRIRLEALPPEARVLAEAEDVVIALRNILENAIESMTTMRDGQDFRGGTVYVSVRPSEGGGAGGGPREPGSACETGAEHGYWVISVRDEGVGIRKEDLPRLFDPFFSTKEDGAAHGLGLSMVYIMARSHGGFVEVESTPGKGSEFLLYLPRYVGEAGRARVG
jgi:PAS domain S-box-containing protein